MQKILDDLVNNVKENIPGYIAISVAEIASGECLVSNSSVPEFDTTLAAAYNVEIINAKRKAIKTLGLEENLRDIHFNLDKQIHIIDIAPSGEYFVYLAIDSKKANIALSRKLLNKYTKELNDEL
ncbi:hypothetical protein [Tenacibaculum finnmarkense]|uniref:Roadblock/LAMTOR2 domain-containing protein n=1 Tax=Tenacibaculum finnmarkense genomovar ulcerans TaxID=2781388 RepID=A0A2I2M8L0_9FLAO|nr:hypothetical protein [Tenacibaculum finnmarkense]MBE7633094.1 hypothetical protein [Tenacibaculum finnmarkense genomovar ulcerans]MBE7696944.1 hypothetical protein [Tenacibaculum finnmarkense genomovar ulcerans]MCD8409285.1 hypothetical protein [Tenacibaculum finnmarkense genomovar ulcerans]MCD8429013.1 hypothetical protein [Tenacibaculum finnmarkense genomovar ulcerans]MCG8235289.1 hypothetical protein [Tenacibaculum finnmarkense genomovar ulcerans]